MLTNAFYTALAAAVREEAFLVAVGGGAAAWDETGPPPPGREAARLAAELARVPVPPGQVEFVDALGRPSRRPSPRLRVWAELGPGEGTGTLRECGLFIAGEERDGALVSYFTHRRIDKSADMRLTRSFVLDLEARPVAPGSQETQWLGNTFTQELHNLRNLQPGCQVDEMRFDRRYFFPSLEAARAAGYDPCAYCFGRALSNR